MTSTIFRVASYIGIAIVIVYVGKGCYTEANFLFTLVVWAWGKADYCELKDGLKEAMRGR